jgi:hypothetical protein
MAEKGKVFTGARARLSVNGVKVGYARNCNGREELQHEPVEALDNIQVEENVPTRYRVSFSMGFVRVVGTSLKSLGWFPQLGQNPEEHLTNVLTQGILTVTIEDNQTGAVFMTLEQASATSRNFTIDATGIVGIDVDFVGIRMRDESEV